MANQVFAKGSCDLHSTQEILWPLRMCIRQGETKTQCQLLQLPSCLAVCWIISIKLACFSILHFPWVNFFFCQNAVIFPFLVAKNLRTENDNNNCCCQCWNSTVHGIIKIKVKTTGLILLMPLKKPFLRLKLQLNLWKCLEESKGSLCPWRTLPLQGCLWHPKEHNSWVSRAGCTTWLWH